MGKKQQGHAFAAANLPSAPLKKTWPPRAEALAAHRRCTHKRGPRKSPMARTRDSLRAGGVLLLFFSKIIPLRGPSPRRRGSVLSETRKNAARRPIPAQAVKIQRNSLAKLRCDHRPSRKDTMIVSRKTPFFGEKRRTPKPPIRRIDHAERRQSPSKFSEKTVGNDVFPSQPIGHPRFLHFRATRPETALFRRPRLSRPCGYLNFAIGVIMSSGAPRPAARKSGSRAP